jgi:hypothetical protein
MPLMPVTLRPIEDVLKEAEGRVAFLTPRDCAGAWVSVFGEAATRMPQPFRLYGDDELRLLGLGFPLAAGQAWEIFLRDLGRLVDAEAVQRRNVAESGHIDKTNLVELRRVVAGRITELVENAVLYDYGQRLPEILWLVVTKEIADRVHAATLAAAAANSQMAPRALDELRYSVAQRLTEVAHRGESEALSHMRRTEGLEPGPAARAFSRLLRDDLMPFANNQLVFGTAQLIAYLQGHLRVDADWYRKVTASAASQLQTLREKDPGFDRVLATLDPDAPALANDRLLFNSAALSLLETWPHKETPRLPGELRGLLSELGPRCKRQEVISLLRSRVCYVDVRGPLYASRLQGRPVQLSSFTRPLDFTASGVVPSVVRRCGLIYDLVEFTQILEGLRRRGRATEENAMRAMVRFLGQVDEIRERHRLKFEKFLGDGAFLSARSARAVMLAAAEIRLLYERLRRSGFPFDEGLRIAVNVGSYHLLPMVAPTADRPQFEFFGHGVVELARLTTGKRTHEVEDIADFLISSGYDVHKVLQFLEPVRQSIRVPDSVRGRAYAAYLAENGELVNLGGVLTEDFTRELEVEWGEGTLQQVEADGSRWLVLTPPCAGTGPYWIGLRLLGTAKLKGLDSVQLVETVTFEQEPPRAVPLPPDTPLLLMLQRLAGSASEPQAQAATPATEVDPRLCVVSVLDDHSLPTWYIGQFKEEAHALEHAFRIGLTPVGLKDGEPLEVWLFHRRGELATLYQGLRRDSEGAMVPLETLREHEGYFACLLLTPQRSPR